MRTYSLQYKQKMIERMTGVSAIRANELAKEIGVRQATLSPSSMTNRQIRKLQRELARKDKAQAAGARTSRGSASTLDSPRAP